MKKWFTLIELMIVISIIWILGAALFPSMTWYIRRSRDATRVADMRKISNAIDAYYTDKESYPIQYKFGVYYCFPNWPSMVGSYISQTSVLGVYCMGPIMSSLAHLEIFTWSLVELKYLDSLPTDPLYPHDNWCALPSNYCYSYSTGSISYYLLSAIFEWGENAGNIPAFIMPISPSANQYNQFKNNKKGSGSWYILIK